LNYNIYMARLRAFFARPFTQVLLIWGIAFLTYSFVSRPVEKIWDFQLHNQTANGLTNQIAYIANGPSGIRIININNPEQMKEEGYFLCAHPSTGHGAWRYIFQNCAKHAKSLTISNNSLFLADGRNGLWMLDISQDPFHPVVQGHETKIGSTQGVVVLDNYAYVAADRQGIRIVRIKDNKDASNQGTPNQPPNQLEDQNSLAITGKFKALKIFSDGKTIYWLDNKKTIHFLNVDEKEAPYQIGTQKLKYNLQDMTFQGKYAFVAAGDSGLLIMEKNNLPEFKQIATIAPVGPNQKKGSTLGVFVAGDHAYLAVKGIGLVIIDITDINNPKQIQSVYEVAGAPNQVIVQDDYAYLSTGLNGLMSIETSVLVNTEILGQTGAQMSARDVAIDGNYVYVAAGESGLRVLDVTSPSNPQEVAFHDTYGQSDAVATKGEIAYIADRNNGLVIVDGTSHSGALSLIGHISSNNARDVAVAENYAYVADSDEGLYIVDIADPANAKKIKTMDPIPGQTVNPIGVTVLGDYAYLANLEQGIRIINVYDKEIPTQVQQIVTPGQSDARKVGLIAFNEQAALTPGQDPFNPDLNNSATKVYAYVANGIYGLQVIDVSNPKEQIPVLLPLNDKIKTLAGIAMDISIDRDRAYLAYDGGGIYILDTTNPASPNYLGTVYLQETENRAVSLTNVGTTIYLASLSHGISIIDSSNPAQPGIIGRYDAPESVSNMAVQGTYAYTVDGKRGLWVYDVSDPKLPNAIQFLAIPEASGVAVNDDYAYIAAGSSGLKVVNIVERSNPMIVAGVDTDGFAQAVLVIGKPGSDPPISYAFIADRENGLVVVDITNPLAPMKIGGLHQIGNAIKLVNRDQDYIFVSADQNGFTSVNVVDPTNPAGMDVIKAVQFTRGAAIVGDEFAYIAGANDGLRIYNVAFPLHMEESVEYQRPVSGNWIEDASIPLPIVISDTITTTMTVIPNYAFLAERNIGISILETTNPNHPLDRGKWEAPVESDSLSESNLVPDVIQVVAVWTPPQSNESTPGFFHLYVADTWHGFSILEGTKKTAFKYGDTYETTGTPTLQALIAYVKGSIRGEDNLSPKVSLAIQQWLMDIVLFGIVSLFFWLGFMSLFILPINRFTEWDGLFSRLVYFLFDRHGPLFTARLGQTNLTREEEVMTGPGLALIDASSVLVLERRNMSGANPARPLSLARVASSGIVLSGNRNLLARPRFDEVLRGVADLRPQVRFATSVNGYTRDGIEVETTIISIFTLAEPPEVLRVAYVMPQAQEGEQPSKDIQHQPIGNLSIVQINGSQDTRQFEAIPNEIIDPDDRNEIEQFIQAEHLMMPLPEWERQQAINLDNNGAPFTYDPVRIFRAIYARSTEIPGLEDIEWTELPNFIVTGIFHDLLAGEMYDRLYLPLNAGPLPLRDLRTLLNRLIRNQGVLSYQYVKRKDDKPFRANERIPADQIMVSNVQSLTNVLPINNPKLLRARGIGMRFAGFTDLRPTRPEVRQQFFERWQAERRRDQDIILGGLELRAMRLRNQWRLEMQREILDEFLNILDANPSANDALAIHVLQALENAATDPETNRLLRDDTLAMLRNLHGWLLH
jgi:hypothetical protein